MIGWIKLHRKMIENPGYFSETFCRNMAWIDLLLLANHETGYIRQRGVRVAVNRGQVGYSQESLASRWKWSRGKVIRFLAELTEDKQIVQQKTNVTTLISIVNYNNYQEVEQQTEQQIGHVIEQQTDSKRYRNKNDKNDKKKKITPTPPVSEEKITKEKNPNWQKIVDTWFTFYKQKFSNDPTFKPSDAACLKKIISIAKKRAEKSHIEWSEENSAKWFQTFFANAYKFDWIAKNYSIPILYSQIDKILNTSNDASSNQTSKSKFSQNRRESSLVAVLEDLTKELGGDLGRREFKSDEAPIHDEAIA